MTSNSIDITSILSVPKCFGKPLRKFFMRAPLGPAYKTTSTGEYKSTGLPLISYLGLLALEGVSTASILIPLFSIHNKVNELKCGDNPQHFKTTGWMQRNFPVDTEGVKIPDTVTFSYFTKIMELSCTSDSDELLQSEEVKRRLTEEMLIVASTLDYYNQREAIDSNKSTITDQGITINLSTSDFDKLLKLDPTVKSRLN